MILITRPRVESNIFSKELSKYNIKTCIEPLISFSYYKNIFFEDVSANYIIGSTRSVEVLEKNFSIFKKILESGKFYVIGVRVKNKLEEIGINNIEGTFDDSFQLIEFLSKKRFNKNPFIYLCSNLFNNNLLKELKNLEINIEQKFLYQTIQKKKLSKVTASLIENEKINSVVLFSSSTAETFIKLIANANLMAKAKNLQFFCLSPGIAKVLKSQQFRYVYFCQSPNQEEMIEMLKNYKNT